MIHTVEIANIRCKMNQSFCRRESQTLQKQKQKKIIGEIRRKSANVNEKYKRKQIADQSSSIFKTSICFNDSSNEVKIKNEFIGKAQITDSLFLIQKQLEILLEIELNSKSELVSKLINKMRLIKLTLDKTYASTKNGNKKIKVIVSYISQTFETKGNCNLDMCSPTILESQYSCIDETRLKFKVKQKQFFSKS